MSSWLRLTMAAEQIHATRQESSILAVHTKQRFEAVTTLKNEGIGIRAIVRQLGLARETVRRYHYASSVDISRSIGIRMMFETADLTPKNRLHITVLRTDMTAARALRGGVCRRNFHYRHLVVKTLREARLGSVFANEQHIDVKVTERVYQDLVAADADPDNQAEKSATYKAPKRIKSVVLQELAELVQLHRSPWKRKEILAYFDTGASNSPAEEVNDRLEHLQGIALSFRNLEHFILRSLIHSGQLRERINAL